MKEMTKEKLCIEFAEACKLAGFNPSKDTLAATVERFYQRKLRHLLLSIEGGAMLLICADPKMGKRIMKALDEINTENQDALPNDCEMFVYPEKDAPQSEFNNFFCSIENAIGDDL